MISWILYPVLFFTVGSMMNIKDQTRLFKWNNMQNRGLKNTLRNLSSSQVKVFHGNHRLELMVFLCFYLEDILKDRTFPSSAVSCHAVQICHVNIWSYHENGYCHWTSDGVPWFLTPTAAIIIIIAATTTALLTVEINTRLLKVSSRRSSS